LQNTECGLFLKYAVSPGSVFMVGSWVVNILSLVLNKTCTVCMNEWMYLILRHIATNVVVMEKQYVHNLWEKLLYKKCVFWFSLQTFLKYFPCKASFILVQF
jgi:hypothetical protein